MDNVRYFNKDQIGYPTNDDVAALRLVKALVGDSNQRGPLYAYKPGALQADKGGDHDYSNIATAPSTVADGMKLWHAAHRDVIAQKSAAVDWLSMLDTRAGLGQAPAYNTFSVIGYTGDEYSQEPDIQLARKRLWSRLGKYGAVYGINPVSMARALTTVMVKAMRDEGTVAGHLALAANNNVAAAINAYSLSQANVDLVRPNFLPEVYTKMFGAPPFLDPSNFRDVSTYPASAFVGGKGGKRKGKKRRRKSYY